MVVLYWIRKDIARWKSFVSNRVAEIVNILPASCWNHIKESENPADLISRDATPAHLREGQIWWNRPGSLSDPQKSTSNCETKMTNDDASWVEEESKKGFSICNIAMQSSSNETFDRFIQLTKIERVLAYCLRCSSNCHKSKKERTLSKLPLRELDVARRKIIKHSQRIFFQDDLKIFSR